jgi:hypothetical protein
MEHFYVAHRQPAIEGHTIAAYPTLREGNDPTGV